MKRVMIGCLIGILGLVSLNSALAQEATAEPSDSQPLVEPTTEIIPVIEPSSTEEIIIVDPLTPVTATILPTETPTLDVTTSQTAVVPTQETQTVIVIPVVDGNVPVVPSQTLVPTATPTLELRSITGQALYPNRVTGQAFIQVQAFAPDNTLIATTTTDARGNYALTILADQVTRVELAAPLHLGETLYLAPGVSPVIVILRAGDLDGNGCVGLADINLLTTSYGKAFAGADIDGSGMVDVIDLTLLSGNYDGSCEIPVQNVTATPTAVMPAATAEIDITATSEVIATEELVPATATLVPTEAIPTAEVTIAPPLPTEVPLPSPTAVVPSIPVEPTVEATAQL